MGTPKLGSGPTFKVKGGRAAKKIAAIEGAEDMKISHSNTDSGRSDGDTDEMGEEGSSSIMLDEALDLLSQRWDRINGAQALKLLPKETKLQVLVLSLDILKERINQKDTSTQPMFMCVNLKHLISSQIVS